MNDSRDCGNPDVLMSYLYDEGPREDRHAFEAHLRECGRCAAELEALRGVRGDLAAWTPPETVLDFRV
ncbi:MAG: anti-sigma factor family protein, partial [Rhodospirillaceae bacterium]